MEIVRSKGLAIIARLIRKGKLSQAAELTKKYIRRKGIVGSKRKMFRLTQAVRHIKKSSQ